MYCQLLGNVHYYIVALLISIALIGDYAVLHTKLQLYRALFDNTTHAIIGGISWLLVCLVFKNRYSSQTLFEIILCTLISSLIDLDHFLAARSLNLKDATNLHHRPPLHCSTFPLLLLPVFLFIGYMLNSKWLIKLALIVFTAFATHHIRDATRRGFCFYPFGSTPPFPYVAYIGLTVAIPYCVCFIMFYVQAEKQLDGFPSMTV